MKTVCSITIGVIVSLMAATVFAESIPYQFTQVDIVIPGSSTGLTLQDINDDGVLLTNVRINNLAEAVIANPEGQENVFKTTTFSCTGVPFADTSASSINSKGQIVGSCADAPSAPSRELGFVRRRNGDHILLDFPGADHTLAFGMNDRKDVVGHYYNPLVAGQSGLFRIHGFLWDGKNYSTLDFPRANTYTMLWSINRSGQILGESYTFNPATNETLAHNWFVYDNGNFTMDFPESLEYIGGPAISLADLNNNGQIVGQRWNAGPEWNGVFLYENGTFYDIEFPAGWLVTDVRGMNNNGQFVGTYAVQVGIDPFHGSPIYEQHGYVATPAPQRKPGELLGPAISLNLFQSNSTGSAALTSKSPVRNLVRVKHSNFGKQFLKSLTPE